MIRPLRSLGILVVPLLLAVAALVPRRGGPVHTPFPDAHPLTAPDTGPGFHFAILGDRTNGKPEGLGVLREAVAEIDRLDPDFVMTVGDLVNGYNTGDEWLAQMREYKSVMDGLTMPWYPVAGNHDVYGKDGDPTDHGNEARYQENFGPLYYSFDHGCAHFVVLYSDEQLSFKDPAHDQAMSAEQLEWLRADLAATTARHVFVFLHHPRWNYAGNVWDPVHAVLAASGKVRAVFAGHWHRYRSDGAVDGIRYYALAATGANIGPLREAGQLHHFNLVSVREDGWSMGVLPVGSVWDPDFVTGAESDDCLALNDGVWLGIEGAATVPLVAPGESRVRVHLSNVTRKEVAYRYAWSHDARFALRPEQGEVRVGARSDSSFEVVVASRPGGDGGAVPAPVLRVTARYPLNGGGVQEVEKTAPLGLEFPALPPELCRDDPDAPDRVLVLDGRDAAVRIPDDDRLDPGDSFTAECWVRVTRLGGRTGLLNKTEQSSWGLFLRPGLDQGPSFSVFLTGAGYCSATAPEGSVPVGRWVHVAGVFDDHTASLYLDGKVMAMARRDGVPAPNDLPLMVGADVGRAGLPSSFVQGEMDEVRLSRGARYQGDFTPARRFTADGDTILLLHLDRVYGNRTPDCSGNGLHGELLGGAHLGERSADEDQGDG